MQGGRNEIIKIQNNIRRPSGQWSKYVAKFLVFLHENRFDKAPKFIRFMDAYKYKKISYGEIIECIIERLEYLVEFMISKAEGRDRQFIRNIIDGHHIAYLSDIEDLKSFLSTVK